MTKKFTELPEGTNPSTDDLISVVDDPAGTPVSQKMTLSNFFKVINGLSAETAPASGDKMLLFDADAAAADSITFAALMAGIEDALTEITSGFASSDTMMIIDGGVAKYTTIANFFSGAEDSLSELTTRPAQSDTFVVVDGGTAKYVQKRNIQTRYTQVRLVEASTAVTVVDEVGSWNLHIPADLDGLDLVEAHAWTDSAGSAGTMTMQIHNITQAADMLSTKLQIDSTETGSDTAATAYVIDTANDDVAENDKIRIDIDTIHTGSAANGLVVTLGFA